MHLCRLSLAWGLPQTEIEQSVAARDIDEMLRYWGQEPWGPWRDNVHAAQICALLANIHRNKGTPAYSHEDFMLTDRQSRAQSRKAKVVAFFKGLAGRKVNDGDS